MHAKRICDFIFCVFYYYRLFLLLNIFYIFNNSVVVFHWLWAVNAGLMNIVGVTQTSCVSTTVHGICNYSKSTSLTVYCHFIARITISTTIVFIISIFQTSVSLSEIKFYTKPMSWLNPLQSNGNKWRNLHDLFVYVGHLSLITNTSLFFIIKLIG